ncbi:MAG: TRAP transporter small permease [Oscillospiraceae bacterium]
MIILLLSVWLTKLGADSFLRPSIANQISVELHISVKWIYLGIPVGLGAMALFAIEKLLKVIRELKAVGSAAPGRRLNRHDHCHYRICGPALHRHAHRHLPGPVRHRPHHHHGQPGLL